MTRSTRFAALGAVALAAAIGGTAFGADGAARACRAWHPHADTVGSEHSVHPAGPTVGDTRDPWTPHALVAEPLHDPWSPITPASGIDRHSWNPAAPERQRDAWHPDAGWSDDCPMPSPPLGVDAPHPTLLPTPHPTRQTPLTYHSHHQEQP